MNGSSASRITVGGLLLFTTPILGMRATAEEWPHGSRNLRIAVHAYMYASPQMKVLKRAQWVAKRVFSQARIEINWISCPTNENERSKHPACRITSGSYPLVLRIMRNAPEELSDREHICGKAYLGDPSESAIVADIYLDRVQKATPENPYVGLDRLTTDSMRPHLWSGVTLGVVMAHEIGHLLLGTDSHYPQGIMKPRWNQRDLENAFYGRQLFTAGQMKMLRANVARRAER